MVEQLDHEVRDEGSIVTITPLSDAARDWIAENIHGDSQWFGSALCVEHRYAGEILYAMQEDGLQSNVTVKMS